MSNLKDLVPPLELCKLIPEGEFAESALMFACQPNDDDEEEVNIFTRDMIEHLEKRWGGTPYTLYPAPTLQEIMAEIPFAQVSILANVSFVIHPRFGEKRNVRCHDDNAAAAALKLWYKLKGIEHAE